MMTRWTPILGLAAALLATPAQAGPPRNAYEDGLVAAVQNHIDVYRSWDLDAFVETFSEDAVITVDGDGATGRDEIRAFYRSNFADEPHTIRILESGVRKGLVYLTMSYTFKDGLERCCSYANYFVKDGKIAYLDVKMSGRQKLVVRAKPKEEPTNPSVTDPDAKSEM
ncbi:MAG: nuclear transport factor 2 family protein [Pseudomonadota bacterium]